MSIEPVCRGHIGGRGRPASRCGEQDCLGSSSRKHADGLSSGLIQRCSVGHTAFRQQFAVAKGAEGVPVADQCVGRLADAGGLTWVVA